MSQLLLSLRYAGRELRGGLKGFSVFLAAIILGVMAIALIGTLTRSIQQGLAEEGRAILGGDLGVRVIQRQLQADEMAQLRTLGKVSVQATLRGMVRTFDENDQSVAEIKVVDDLYPLAGTFQLAAEPWDISLLAPNNDIWGAVAEEGLAARLNLSVGDQFKLGEASFILKDIIVSEPDRLSSGLGFGPRLIISQAALSDTGLVQPGSLVNWHYKNRAEQCFV
jgi:putative ABC transport system permease protein